MGMTIDDIIQGLNETIIICNSVYDFDHNKYIDEAKDKIYKYQQLQADYEQRLKADMVAMLSEIQLEIEEHTMTSGVINQGTWNECIACCSRVIQQKINALRSGEDGENNN